MSYILKHLVSTQLLDVNTHSFSQPAIQFVHLDKLGVYFIITTVACISITENKHCRIVLPTMQ